MGSYAHTTLLSARTTLAGSRLDNSALTFWVSGELNIYLAESLRTFNAIGRWNKNSFPVQTVAGTTFYNVMDHMQMPLTLLPDTVTDQYLVNQIQYMLMEPVNTWTGAPGSSPGFTWNGSEQFTMADVVGAIQRKRDEFLMLTGMVLSQSELPASPPPVANIQLPDTYIDVRRAAWKDITPTFASPSGPATYYPMTRADRYSFDLGQHDWNLNGSHPYAWSTTGDPLLTLQLAPISPILGAVNLVYVASGPPLDVTANAGAGTVLGIPDDFTWIVLFGALWTLLAKDGESQDLTRAEYCRQRWETGIELARLASSVLRAQVDGLYVPLSSLPDADGYFPGWQNGTGTPTNIIQCGYNLIAASPQPVSRTHEVTLDCVVNATVPIADTDQLQVGREHVEAILDYAQHLALFKSGGGEFANSSSLMQRFFSIAMDNNDRLKANMPLYKAMMGMASKPMDEQPMREMAA